jgi:hypothetical protein
MGCINDQVCEDGDLFIDFKLASESVNKYVGQLYDKAIKEKPKNTNIRPKHYEALNDDKIEAIDVMDQAVEGLSGIEGGYIFTVLRYILRWKNKGGLEDLKKAHTYLGRLINIIGEGEHKW